MTDFERLLEKHPRPWTRNAKRLVQFQDANGKWLPGRYIEKGSSEDILWSGIVEAVNGYQPSTLLGALNPQGSVGP